MSEPVFLPPELPLTPEDWGRTPLTVQAVVVKLWRQSQALQAQVGVLQAEVERLRERANQTSQNSSMPPSSDPPHAPARSRRTPSGRTRGGQKGHTGHGRSHQPSDQVERVIPVRPVACGQCGTLLLGEDPHPERHQVTELPRIVPQVLEYQRHTLTCVACGTKTAADWPADMPTGSFGPRTQATVGYLSGRLGVSQRDIKEVMETVFHTEIGLGSIPAQERQVSAALAEPVQEAHLYLQKQPVANADETSWPQGNRRSWLWIGVTAVVTVFLLFARRNTEGAKRLLGASFRGIVGSDRFSAYNWLDILRRQLCWAHLKRDFQALVDRGGASERLGGLLLEQVKEMFDLWHQVRDGTLSRAGFQETMRPIQQQVGELLREGATLAHPKTRHTCQNILKLEAALWTFVKVEGVEPTNNAAERPLRRAVLWRHRSFGTQSEEGSRFVERVLTTVATLRQQQRDVLDYLTEACAARIRGAKPPSLLPNPQTTNSTT